MVGVLLVVKLQPVIALSPVVADPRHAVDDQRFDPQRLEAGRRGDAGMPTAHDQHGWVSIGIARGFTAAVEPVGPVEVAFESGFLGLLEDRLLLVAAQRLERCQ